MLDSVGLDLHVGLIVSLKSLHQTAKQFFEDVDMPCESPAIDFILVRHKHTNVPYNPEMNHILVDWPTSKRDVVLID